MLVIKNLMVQFEFPGIDPPVNVTAVAVLVTIPPPHCGDAGTPDTVNPAGRVSVNVTPGRRVLLLLINVTVTSLVLPNAIA